METLNHIKLKKLPIGTNLDNLVRPTLQQQWRLFSLSVKKFRQNVSWRSLNYIVTLPETFDTKS